MKLKDLNPGQSFRFADDTERLKLRGWDSATYSAIGDFEYETVCEGTAPRLRQLESNDVRIFSSSTYDRDVVPEVVQIKSVYELKVGMIMCYTGQPRGTGIYVPEIGSCREIKDESDIIEFSIEIIERGRGWRPTKESYERVNKNNHPVS